MNKVNGLVYLSTVLNNGSRYKTHVEIVTILNKLCKAIGIDVTIDHNLTGVKVKYIMSLKDNPKVITFETEPLVSRYYANGYMYTLLKVYSLLTYDVKLLDIKNIEYDVLEEYLKITMSDYYDKNDDAHKFNHVADVIDLTKKMISFKEEKYHDNLVLLAGYTHDMFSSVSRTDHHLEASSYVDDIERNILKWLMTDDDALLVSDAVRQHRASYKGEYNSMLSELFASGDRGVPSIDLVVTRCYESAIKMSNNFKEFDNREFKNCSDGNVAFVKTLIHLQNKFSTNGYAKLPAVYKEYFTDELVELQQWCDRITPIMLQDKLEELTLVG